MEDTSFQRQFEPIPPAIAVRDIDASMKINKMRVSECQMEVTADHDAQSEYYQADDCCGSKSTTSDDSSCGKMKNEDTDNEIRNDMDKTANDESGYDASTGSEKHSKIIRHENGHLSLANCIYSDLPGQHLDHPSPFCSDLSSFSHSSAGSWPDSSKSLQGDSGVSSEDAESYLQPSSQEETREGTSNQSSSKETNSTNSHAVNFECLDCENGNRISREENEIHNSVSEANTYTNPIMDGTNTSPQLLRQTSSDVTVTVTENTEEDKEKQNVKNSVGKDTRCSVTSLCSLPRKTSTRQEEIVHKNYSDNSLSESLCEKYSSCRWKFAFLCFLARFFQSSIRQCMGIAVIGMTVRTALGGEHIFQQATSNSSGINITVTVSTSQLLYVTVSTSQLLYVTVSTRQLLCVTVSTIQLLYNCKYQPSAVCKSNYQSAVVCNCKYQPAVVCNCKYEPAVMCNCKYQPAFVCNSKSSQQVYVTKYQPVVVCNSKYQSAVVCNSKYQSAVVCNCKYQTAVVL